MRTITIYKNVYKYDELSEEAKQNVRIWLEAGATYYYDEIKESIKAIREAIGAETGVTWDEITSRRYDNVVGLRAYKYIWNNYIYPNRKAKYLRWSDKKNNPMYSRLQFEYSCNFTGCTYDYILWDAWQDWKDYFQHSKTGKSQSVEDFFYILSAKAKDEFDNAEKYLFSDEYAKDMCEANSYEFDEYGKIA